MEYVNKKAIEDLRLAREEIISIPKERLSSNEMQNWLGRWRPAFVRVQNITGTLVWYSISKKLEGYSTFEDTDIFMDIRSYAVNLLDKQIQQIDKEAIVRPTIEELILKIKDTKLSTLLKEFNSSKDANPNLSALGFRTIISLIIKERAKIVRPTSVLAGKDDIDFEPDIKSAISEGIFSSNWPDPRILDTKVERS